MEKIIINGVKYSLTPIKETEKKEKSIILEKTIKFEVCLKDIGKHTFGSIKNVLNEGWRVPTKEEFDLINSNKDIIEGLQIDNYYWVDIDPNTPWVYSLYTGYKYVSSTDAPHYVIMVRTVS